MIQEHPTQQGLWNHFGRALTRTRHRFVSGIYDLFKGRVKLDDELYNELETRLLVADVGSSTTEQILKQIRETVRRQKITTAEEMFAQFQHNLVQRATALHQPFVLNQVRPYVILVVGVNGVGKTTTIGKLAFRFKQEGHSVVLAAGDTYRAAAIQQLQTWGHRNSIPVVAQRPGADCASVIHDAVQNARARGIDIVIADTAGRLQTKSGLMDELSKVGRVLRRLEPTAPQQCLLILDATIGQNALSQLQLFDQALQITGLIMTKLDGSAKGGVLLALSSQTDLPLYFVGLGEAMDALQPYDPAAYVEGLIQS